MQLIEWLLLALLIVLAPAWEFRRGPAYRARLQADIGCMRCLWANCGFANRGFNTQG